jgi:hypothetical protein
MANQLDTSGDRSSAVGARVASAILMLITLGMTGCDSECVRQCKKDAPNVEALTPGYCLDVCEKYGDRMNVPGG